MFYLYVFDIETDPPFLYNSYGSLVAANSAADRLPLRWAIQYTARPALDADRMYFTPDDRA